MEFGAVTHEMVANDIVEQTMSMVSGDHYFYPDRPDVQDVSFTAILRALLYGRMDADDHLTLQLRRINVQKGRNIDEDVFEQNGVFLRSSITVCSFRNSYMSDDKRYYEAVQYFEQNHREYKKLDGVTKFYKKYGYTVSAYVNEETKSCVVLVVAFHCMSFYHFLAYSTPILLPWYFRDRPVEGDEIDMLLATAAASHPERLVYKIRGVYDRIANSIVQSGV